MFIVTNQGIPSFTLNISYLIIMSKSNFTYLGPTRTDKVMQPRGGTEIPLCVWMVLLDSSYPSLCKKLIRIISSVIAFTKHIGSTRTPVTVFTLIHAGMYKGDGSLL